ncbi:DUF2867 domain-containing protein [Cereibacter sphaeroides f. sp. denitrificans]
MRIFRLNDSKVHGSFDANIGRPGSSRSAKVTREQSTVPYPGNDPSSVGTAPDYGLGGKMSGAKKADLMAAEAVLKTPRDQLDYRHSDEAFIAPGLTALDVYRAMTSSNPLYLRVAFRIRDMLCRPAGIAPIGGFSAGDLPGTVTAGDRIDFFDVHSATDDELVLFSDDRHLTVVVALRLTRESPARQKLSIVTSVKVKEMLGRLYMLPVRPAHGVIVRGMLKSIHR